jgi:site-specific DNA recombinase
MATIGQPPFGAVNQNGAPISARFIFREAWHPSTHPPLVPTELFSAAQALLLDRSENIAKRASNSSEYLLTGLIVCERCKRHFTGTAAHGRNGIYRYYTCASRQRSGSDACHAPRLPADALDDAVIEALVHTYERTDVFVEAAANATRRDTSRTRIETELLAVQAELAKSQAAIERYLAAFESGALPESTCGERVSKLRHRSSWQRCARWSSRRFGQARERRQRSSYRTSSKRSALINATRSTQAFAIQTAAN